MTFLLAFSSAFLISLISTPIVIKLALYCGIVDHPNERKVHEGVMPRMGGLSMYIGLILTYFMLVYFELFEPVRFINAFLIGATLIVITGVLDDNFQLSPKQKLIGQTLAAFVVVFYGEKVNLIHIPLFDGTVQLGWFGIPITILWVVGVTNAINLIDGLDGLAAGVSGIAALSLFSVSLLMGNMVVAVILITLVGAIIGFLFFNFHPAKIFMGDTGSLFLGFSLATLSLLEFKQVTIITFIIPIMILGVPIADTLFAMFRRYLNGVPMTSPDKNHLHHRLLSRGLSHKKVVMVIYAISSFFGLLAVLSIKTPFWVSILIAIFACILMEYVAELVGLLDEHRFKPLMQLFKKNKKN